MCGFGFGTRSNYGVLVEIAISTNHVDVNDSSGGSVSLNDVLHAWCTGLRAPSAGVFVSVILWQP